MKRTLLAISVALALVCCTRSERPLAPDGDGAIRLVVVDVSGALLPDLETDEPIEPLAVAQAKVTLQSRTHIYNVSTQSDTDGMAFFKDLPAGEYSVFARREIAGANLVITGYADLKVSGTGEVFDTLYTTSVRVNALMINEIYYCGSDRGKFYFYDQYVELYNASDDTLYLDGCILTRNFPTVTIGEDGIADNEKIDHVRAIYAFQFPGTPVTGREYPIYPRQYVVVAGDAVDHSLYAADAYDLSGADWEFFNPLGNDYDVPGVPNVTSIHPTSTIDFLINLSANAVVLTTGEEWEAEDYINSSGYPRVRVIMPLHTVIDGVEYSANPKTVKELTVRVDAGYAGIGCAKYSGQSVERREVGVDTNNSTFDFVLIPRGTPGWHHVEGKP